MRTIGFARTTDIDKWNNTARARRWILGFVFATLAASPVMAQEWPMFGSDTTNTASNGSNISTENVAKLKVKGTFTTNGDVSARAAVVNDVAFFPDWGGNIWAVDTRKGKLV